MEIKSETSVVPDIKGRDISREVEKKLKDVGGISIMGRTKLPPEDFGLEPVEETPRPTPRPRGLPII